MGHSMGGAGTYYLGAKYNDIWAGIAPISGAGGIADAAAAERYRSFVTLLMHGEKDSIVSPSDHVVRRCCCRAPARNTSIWSSPARTTSSGFGAAAENMEKVFLLLRHGVEADQQGVHHA